MNKNIPEDLWPEILCRLPVKSLLRFRCVSNSWQSMIDDPDFRHLHLKCFENNTRQTRLLFLQDGASKQDFVVKRSDTMETTVTVGSSMIGNLLLLGPKSNFDNVGYPGDWAVVCLMDGAILLTEDRSSNLLLWNPSIRKFHSIPPLPEAYGRMKGGSFGLGFDPLTKDYKHVRFARLGESDLHSVFVYSVQAGFWTVIRFEGEGSSGWHWSFSHNLGPRGFRTVCFQGHLCFIARNLDLNTIELVSFDLSNEEFASIRLPGDDEECAFTFRLKLAVINDECLLVKYKVSHDAESTSGSIWVLESPGAETGFEPMYWKKRCSCCIGVPDLLFINVLKNGDLLARSFTKVVRYDVVTHEVKIVLNQGDAAYVREHGAAIIDVHEYNESLMLLK